MLFSNLQDNAKDVMKGAFNLCTITFADIIVWMYQCICYMCRVVQVMKTYIYYKRNGVNIHLPFKSLFSDFIFLKQSDC